MTVAGLARWQGAVDTKLDTLAADVADHDHRIGGLARQVSALDVTVAKLSVKVGLAAALGGVLSGGILTVVLSFLPHG